MKVYLIRHGESEANARGIYQGQKIDSPLSNLGLAQAKKLANVLRDIKLNAIYSSDLLRAMQTAKEIARFQRVLTIPDARLREFNLGDFSGIENKWGSFSTYKTSEAERLGIRRDEVKTPNGESESDHVNRVGEFIQDFLKEECENVAVVGHAGTNKVFFGGIGYVPRDKMYELPQDNCCLNELEFDGTLWHVCRVNDVRHLG